MIPPRPTSPASFSCSSDSSFSDHQFPSTPLAQTHTQTQSKPFIFPLTAHRPEPPPGPTQARLIVDVGPNRRRWIVSIGALTAQSGHFAREFARREEAEEEEDGVGRATVDVDLSEDRAAGWALMVDALTRPGFWTRPDLTLYDVYALLHLSQKYDFPKVLRNAEKLFDVLCEQEDTTGGYGW